MAGCWTQCGCRQRDRRGGADAERRELEAYSVVEFRAQLRTARLDQPGRLNEGTRAVAAISGSGRQSAVVNVGHHRTQRRH
jgi:hypothetical protein